MWGSGLVTPVAASFHYLVQSPNPLHLGSECSVCTNDLGTLMSRTPHSTNTVSRERPQSNVCNGELGSLCSLARKTRLVFSNLPSTFIATSASFIFFMHTNNTKNDWSIFLDQILSKDGAHSWFIADQPSPTETILMRGIKNVSSSLHQKIHFLWDILVVVCFCLLCLAQHCYQYSATWKVDFSRTQTEYSGNQFWVTLNFSDNDIKNNMT